MCCCGKPTINGEMGYRWQPDNPPTVREPNPPALEDRDVLLYDEPGRCGGLDCHSHHFRVIQHSSFKYLLVRHGGGDERMTLGCTFDLLVKGGSLEAMDSNARYWLLHSLYDAYKEATRRATDSESGKWRKAAAEKRIRTRRLPAQGYIKVWIEEAQAAHA